MRNIGHDFQRLRTVGALLLPVLALLLISQMAVAEDTEEVQALRFAADGRYDIVAGGVGMLDAGTGDIGLNVPGAGVKVAYLYWSGTAALGNGDDTVGLARDGVPVAPTIVADPTDGTYGPSLWYSDYYYYVYVAEVTEYIEPGDHVYTVSDFGEDMRRRDGAGLIVVYEDASLPYSRIVIRDGLDRFYRGWGEGPRGESAVNCGDVGTTESDRQLEFWLFLGEINAGEEPRPNALWYKTGPADESMPTDLVNAPTDGPTDGIMLQGPPDYPFSSADDPQWDTYDNVLTIPAGHGWVCLQVESARDGDYVPASGMWLLTAAKLPAPGLTDVSVLKSDDPDPVVPGEQLSYTLTYANEGESDAEKVVITDTLPLEVSFVDADPYPDDDTNPLSWDLGTLAPGDSGTIAVTVTVGTWVTQTFTNTVIIATETPETNYENNKAIEPTDVVALTDVAIIKSDDPDPVMPSEQLAYTLTYTNHGPSDAINTTVSDTLPLEVTFVDADPYPADDTGPLVWNLGTLDVGETGTIAVTVTVKSWVSQTFTNTVVIATDTPETNYENNRDQEPTDVAPVTDVWILKDDRPDPAHGGGDLIYTLTYGNNGPSDADEVRISDLLPPEVTFVSANPSQASGPNPLVWNLGNLEVGQTGTIEVLVQVRLGVTGTITNVVEISTTTPETNYGNNRAIEPTEVLRPPTAVELLYFRASATGSQILVEWETSWERDNWGFELYRNLTPDFEGAEWLHSELGQGGAYEGHHYRYVDRNILPGKVYYYWLEDVDTAGNAMQHGPVRIAAFYRIYVPTITR